MSRVQLYVYDLSRGLAKSMSMMLTGKQIDGIWHTSVVAYSREVFYGQGILEAKPGTTHHGSPVQIIDCGTTEIDEPTFQEYLTSLQEVYKPDAYHLIEFNCNHFTADVVGFLTGGTIPEWISGLPTEFLSTPFGQSMRPQIDAMFRRTAPTEHPINGSNNNLPTPPPSGISTPTPNPLAAGLLNAVAQRATTSQSPLTPSPTPPTAQTSPLSLVSSTSHFDSLLNSPALIVNFTNTPSCPPCRVIKPIYETIASTHSQTHGTRGLRFVEVELGIGQGQDIASRYKVQATPTFIFFKDGKKVDELKGAGKRELEGKVQDFVESVWPVHPHRKVYLPAVEGIGKEVIVSGNVPAFGALLGKLESFGVGKERVEWLGRKVIPVLEGKGVPGDAELEALIRGWSGVSEGMLQSLKPEETFPLIDLWRVALLNARISALLALHLTPTSPTPTLNPLSPILKLASQTLKAQSTNTPKPFLLTTLRLLTNLTASSPLSNLILASPPSDRVGDMQSQVIEIVVESLLHSDGGVRSAAAGVAVNMGGWRHRLAKEVGDEERMQVDWEVEVEVPWWKRLNGRVMKMFVEAHRLLAALGLSIYLSPGFVDSVQPLLEVLDAKTMLEKKARGFKKKEVKKLAEEISGKMC